MAEYVEARPNVISRRRTPAVPVSAVVINLVLVIGSIAMLVPFAWMIFSAFKSQFEILMSPPTLVPLTWHPENFVDAWNRAPFGRFYLNTAIVAVTTTLSALLFGTMAGFGFAKHRFWGDRVLFVCILTSLMVPIHVTLIPR